MEKLVLVDGHSILNRAFYGLPDLTNAEGLHTNAVYGFLNILFKIAQEENPRFLVVAFDVNKKTFRHEMFTEYKGTRSPMPEELRMQVPLMKEVLQAMGVTIVEQPGFEADDVLGTLAKIGQKKGYDVSLISGDRDLLQIATDKIKIRIPKTKAGKTQIEDYYAEDVVNTYGMDPVTFIDLKALMGDTADNIPGVAKVGQKTATKLLADYKSLDGIYEHVNEITQNAVRQSLIDNKETAYLSKTLATIKTDVYEDFEFSKAEVKNFYTEEAYSYFKRLEFKNFLDRFETTVNNDDITKNFEIVDDITRADEILKEAKKQNKDIGVYALFEDRDTDDLLGISLSTDDNSFFIRKFLFITEDYLKNIIDSLDNSGCRIITADIKNLFRIKNDINVTKYKDICIGAYLINPLKSDVNIIDIASEYLGILVKDKKEFAKKSSLSEEMNKENSDFKDYACFLSYICKNAYPKIEKILSETDCLDLYNELEMPLTEVLFEMEKNGIKVKRDELTDYSKMLSSKISELENKIYELSGEEFNINSPKKLGEILFEKLNLPGGKKTKTGYSTAADVLEKLSAEYEIVRYILDYRTYSKLKSTYADGLFDYIDETQRIHSTFNQTVTATGRLSSTDPNLQNIPVRLELGRQIRKAFVPEDGYIFMDADYSQIELRVLASLSGEQELIKAYENHADIHRQTASIVFHIPYDEVTELDRRKAKAVNFGIVYGISAFGLGEGLSISPKEAKTYIDDYFKTFPKIKEYLDFLVSDAKEKGYSLTYYKRRRPIPELQSSNFMQRSFGERVAMNSPIQGCAADIIKLAMLGVYRRLKKENLKSRLLLQVHDELLLEVQKDEIETVEKILFEEMENVSDLPVKTEIDLNIGLNWYEAK